MTAALRPSVGSAVAPLVVLAVAQVADLVITLHALSIGAAEANPAFAWVLSHGLAWPVKVAGVGFLVYRGIVGRRPGWHLAAWWVIAASSVAVVGWNIAVLASRAVS